MKARVTEHLISLAVLFFAAVNGHYGIYAGFSIIIVQFIHYDRLKKGNKDNIELLVLRLEAYAHLLDKPDCRGTNLLSYSAHKILLGTLKKVEAKAASLLVFLVLTITLTVTLAGQATGDGIMIQLLIYIILFLHPAAIICVLQCFEQMDTFDIEGGGSLERELQYGLIASLSLKEFRFRFAFDMTKLIMIFGFGGLAFLMMPS